MRRSIAFAALLFGLLGGSVATAAAQEKAPAEPPPAESDLGDGKALQLVLDPGGHTAEVTGVLFTPDSKMVITVALDKSIRIWDLATGQARRVLWLPSTTGSPGKIHSAALSPDGARLAVAALVAEDKNVVGRISLIRLSDGLVERLLEGNFRGGFDISHLVFSPDGKRLAAGDSSPRVRIWDTATGKLVQTLDNPKAGPPGVLHGVVFSPDGKFLAGGMGYQGGRCRVWSLESGRILFEQESRATPAAVAWSPDGQLLATSVFPGIKLAKRAGETFQPLSWEEKGHGWALAFTPDGRQVLHAGVREKGKESLILRDVQTGKEVRRFTPAWEKLSKFALSPDGQLIASLGPEPGDIIVWKLEDGAVVRRLTGKGESVAQAVWTADGKGVAWTKRAPAKDAKPVFPRSFRLTDLDFGPEVGKDFHGPLHSLGALTLQPRGAGAVDLLKDGQLFHTLSRFHTPQFTLVGNDYAVLSGSDMSIKNTSTGKFLRELRGHTGLVNSLAATPTGRYLLSAGADQTLRIWAPEQEKQLPARAPIDPLLSLFFAGDDWVAWTQEGYYACSPGGEKFVGWVTPNGPNQLMTFQPAQRFKKFLYRPDVIKRVLDKGSVAEALKSVQAAPQDIEKLLPPKTSVRVQQDGARLTVAVRVAQAGAGSQPVTAMYLLVDGRPVRLAVRREAVERFAPAREKDAQAEWTLTLEAGRHLVSVRSHTPDTYGFSEEIAVEVKSQSPPGTSRRGTLHHVGIGVNQFKHHPELNLIGAVPDVLALEKCLKQSCAEHFRDIRSTVLTDSHAASAAIVKTLTELERKLSPGDVVIVHWSSHGDVADDGGLYLLAHDSKRDELKGTAASGQKLRDVLGGYPCPVLLILDACHSGKFPLRPATDPLTRLLADDSCGVAVLAAALAHQKALDTPQGGVFTRALVEGLQGKADPDKFSKRLYVHNLFTYVYAAVANRTDSKQMPLYLPSGSVPPIVLKE